MTVAVIAGIVCFVSFLLIKVGNSQQKITKRQQHLFRVKRLESENKQLDSYIERIDNIDVKGKTK